MKWLLKLLGAEIIHEHSERRIRRMIEAYEVIEHPAQSLLYRAEFDVSDLTPARCKTVTSIYHSWLQLRYNKPSYEIRSCGRGNVHSAFDDPWPRHFDQS